MKKQNQKMMEQELKKVKETMSSHAKKRGREAGLPEHWLDEWAGVWTDVWSDAWTQGYKKGMEQSIDLFLTIAEQLKLGVSEEQIAKKTGVDNAIIKKVKAIGK